MDPPGYTFLYVLAGLAVTFVGLATIAIILSQETEGHPSPLSIYRSRMYMETGLLAAAFAILPGFLGLFGWPEGTVWWVASALAVPLILAWYAAFPIRRRKRAGVPNPLSVWVNFAVGLSFVLGPAVVLSGHAGGAAAGWYAVAPVGFLLQDWGNFIRNIGLFGTGR